MAIPITINQICKDHEFIYNPFYYEITSTNSNKLSYKFVIDVYADHSAANTYIGRFKVPLRSNGTGLFSPARVLENLVTPVFAHSTTAMTASYNSYVRYKLLVGEEYDTSVTLSASTGVTIYSGLTSTTINYALNAVRQYDQPHNIYTRQYDPVSNLYPYFLTDYNYLNNNVPKKIRRGEYETLGYYSANKSSEYIVQTFDSGGTQIGEYMISNGWNSNSIHHTLGVGTANLNYTATNLVTSSPNNIMNSNVHYYLVYTSFSGQRSLEFEFLIDDSCLTYEPIRLAWLNKWGSFDYYTFTLVSRNTYERKTTEWQSRLTPNYTIGELTRQNLNVDLKKKLTVNTDWLNDHDAKFITGLFESPLVYQVFSDGSYIPMLIIDTSFEEKKNINERMFNYTMNLEYAFNRNVQRT